MAFSWKGIVTKKYKCAAGYALSADKTQCIKQDAVLSQATTMQHVSVNVYGRKGVVFYKSGYGVDGTWDTTNTAKWPNVYSSSMYGNNYNLTNISQGLWANFSQSTASDGSNGRMNQCAVWKQGDINFIGTLGFTQSFTLDTAKTFLVGTGGDNQMVVSLDGNIIFAPNGQTLAQSQYFGTDDVILGYWNIIPVTVPAGTHSITILVENISTPDAPTENPGAIALEIYDATEAQLMACTTVDQLRPYIYFSTMDLANGSSFDASYSCNTGYYLVRQSDGSYACEMYSDPIAYQ